MSWTETIYAIGDLFEASFAGLRMLENNMNYLIIAVGSVMMLWWIMQMIKYKREAEATGGVE